MSAAPSSSPPPNEISDLFSRVEDAVSGFWAWVMNTPNLWLALAIGIAVYFTLIALRGGFMLGLQRLDYKSEASWPGILKNIVSRSGNLFFFAAALYVGSRFVAVPPDVNKVIRYIAVIAGFIQIAAWTSQLLISLLTRHAIIHAQDGAATTSALSLIQLLVRIFVWSTALLLILANVGVNVTALVAGLGIGGIAIGFAAQGILSDLFASLSIVLDRPFITGDFIAFADKKGTVERIGLKTTRIRSITGEQVIISNTDLLKSSIHNFRRMSERRVSFSLGVTYQTAPDQLEAIPGMIRAAVEAQERTRFDRTHFHAYGDSALVFDVVYYVTTPDYAAYMDIHHAVNMAIFRHFADAGIEFAYPTRTLHLGSVPGAIPQ